MKKGFKFDVPKFTCVKCNEPVFKLGKKVNLDLKLCGYCNSLKKGKKAVKKNQNNHQPGSNFARRIERIGI